jgi:hypothetical protein
LAKIPVTVCSTPASSRPRRWRAAQQAFGAQILIEIGPVNAEASGTLSPMGALFGRW